jgi:hypothetical protein
MVSGIGGAGPAVRFSLRLRSSIRLDNELDMEADDCKEFAMAVENRKILFPPYTIDNLIHTSLRTKGTICGHEVQKNRFFGPRGLKHEDYFFILIHDIKHT